MRYFLDTEFIEDGRTIDLISIGVVAEDGREYYAISKEFDGSKASLWVRKNVFPLLPTLQVIGLPNDGGYISCNTEDLPIKYPKEYKSRDVIRKELRNFIGYGIAFEPPPKGRGHGKPEFWAYYADYDWVALCQIFGPMIDLPEGWPMYCNDLKQLMDMRNWDKSQLPTQKGAEHNALEDARWVRDAYNEIMVPEI